MDDRLPPLFRKNIIPEPNSGCWLWLGNQNRHGYGLFYDNSQKRNAQTRLTHRRVWELLRGPIPPRMVVMHACDNPSCVNPDHLSVGTQRENQEDMWRKGRHNLKRKERAYRVANYKPSGHLKCKMYYIP